jgi:monomeric isocitrate dehydrogenase
MDAGGNQTTPDDTPQWSSTDESVASVMAADDGMSASVQVGSPGAAVVEVSTTDSDGDTHVFQGTVTVQPGDVEVGEITFTEEAAAEEPPAEPVA